MRKEAGSRKQEGEARKWTPSPFISSTHHKLCSPGGHFPLRMNLSTYFGRFHLSCPTSSFSTILRRVVWMHCFVQAGEGVGGCHGSPGAPDTQTAFPFLPLEDLEQPLLLGHSGSRSKNLTPDVRICPLLFKLSNSRYTVISWNTRTCKHFPIYFLLSFMSPSCHLPSLPFLGRKCRGITAFKSNVPWFKF